MNPMQEPRKPVLLRNGNPQGNPMNAPRCGAKTRQGTACRGPAMANGRCRMHGGASTGPRTPEGLERSRRAHLKHGRYSAQNIALRREIRDSWRSTRSLWSACVSGRWGALSWRVLDRRGRGAMLTPRPWSMNPQSGGAKRP